jgi:hypothetical protein
LRYLVTFAASLLITSCARPDYGESRPGWFLLSGGAQPGYAIKQIVEKQRPATLIADDGSVCRTSSERFNNTHPGKWIACDWTLPALDSTEPGAN